MSVCKACRCSFSANADTASGEGASAVAAGRGGLAATAHPKLRETGASKIARTLDIAATMPRRDLGGGKFG
jgi:hypothetical protein